MTQYSYTFSIDQPCSENWQQMSVTERGKFCHSCTKEVIDFSSLTDEEIIRTIEQAKGLVCGRFHPKQLNRPMQLSYYVKRPSSLRAILAGIALLTIIAPGMTACDTSDVKTEQHDGSSQKQDLIPLDPRVYKGQLINTTDSLPVTNAEIMLVNTSQKVKPDAQGCFEFPLDDSLSNTFVTINVYIPEVGTNVYMIDALSINEHQREVIYVEANVCEPTMVLGNVSYIKERKMINVSGQ